MPSAQPVRALRTERAVVFFLLFCICALLAHFIHADLFMSAYELRMHPRPPDVPTYYLFQNHPPLHAPDAYRVAIPALGEALMRATHAADITVASLLDFVFALAATGLLYLLGVHDLPPPPGARRLLTIAALLAFIQFPLAWIIPWQRPETLPCTLYLALSLYFVMRLRQGAFWSVLLVVLALWQGFVRADLAVCFGAAFLLLSILPGAPLAAFGTRTQNLLRGLAISLAAGCVQLYLQLVRFPHLPYPPSTPVWMVGYNLTPHSFGDFFLALLPFFAFTGWLLLRRVRVTPVDTLALTVSAVYLLPFVTVANIDEVRVYVPCMFLLALVAARTLPAHALRHLALSSADVS